MNVNLPVMHQTRIVPALHEIQRKFGYLNREAMQQFSKESGIPLYRLQGVASFFPHFELERPPALVVKVCRDMACHMAGSGRILRSLAALDDERIRVEGVSCLGRCDRAPAACVAVHKAAAASEGNDGSARDANPPQVERQSQGGPGSSAPPSAPPEPHTLHDDDHGSHSAHGAHGAEHAELEFFFHGRIADQLKQIANDCLKGRVAQARPNRDADLPYKAADWTIDPYQGKPAEYAGVRKAVELRRASLEKAAEKFRKEYGWTEGKVEQFITSAESRLTGEEPSDDTVLKAVHAWQTDDNWADEFFKELDDAHADLRGLGGAGIPATQKWRDVRDAVRTARRRKEDDRAFIVVNGDESEPGTFKDREILLRAPHTVIEGVILAGLTTEATQGFIYIRHEYPEQIAACEKEIRRAEEMGICGKRASVLGRPFPVSVFVSPGGYICGEQSALIEAMSDRRGEPRNMPPKLETNGLDDRPTLVSNVETYAWVPYIWINGGQTYANQGVNGWKGRRFFSVSGDVNRPGVYEVPTGLTLRELIYGDNYCRGIIRGRKLKAFAPSGPSGGFLPAKLTAKAGLPRKHNENATWKALAGRRGFDPAAQELDILDMELELNFFRALSPTQSLGAGLVVYADGRDMADQAVNALEFFRNESCGKCVPCRIGSQKMATLGGNLLQGRVNPDQWQNDILPIVRELGEVMGLASICGLGRSVPVAVKTLTDFFAADLARHMTPGGLAAAAAVGLSAPPEPAPRGVAPPGAAAGNPLARPAPGVPAPPVPAPPVAAPRTINPDAFGMEGQQ